MYKINQSVYVILSGSQWRSEESKTVQHKNHNTHKTFFKYSFTRCLAKGSGLRGRLLDMTLEVNS